MTKLTTAVDAREAAEIIGCDKQAVYYHARRGDLAPLPSTAAHLMFSRRDVDRFARALKNPTAHEVARILGVTGQTVIRWIEGGQIEGERVGRRWRCTPQGVRVVAEARGVIIPEGAFEGVLDSTG